MPYLCAIFLSLSLFSVFGCSAPKSEGNQQSFEQQFIQWYQENPPSKETLSKSDRSLMERFKPIFYFSNGAKLPIDFYHDYLANGFFEKNKKRIKGPYHQEWLNRHKFDSDLEFTYETGTSPPSEPVVYGRIYRDTVGQDSAVFLEYRLVFSHSGLPSKLSWWKGVGAGLLGALEDWHQLDHYTAVTLVFGHPPGKDIDPIAVFFQQHNYQRSYLFSEEQTLSSLVWPSNNRLKVDVAKRSNELYPHQRGRVLRRAASYMDESQARWLIMGSDLPLKAGYDETQADNEFKDFSLQFLSADDAFYTFRGRLGQRRLLPGREGPPGGDYNTFAAFKAPSSQLFLGYWYEGLEKYPEQIAKITSDAWLGKAVNISPFKQRFLKDLARYKSELKAVSH